MRNDPSVRPVVHLCMRIHTPPLGLVACQFMFMKQIQFLIDFFLAHYNVLQEMMSYLKSNQAAQTARSKIRNFAKRMILSV